jgi:hypothetical protein
MTREEAIALAESGWWKTKTAKEIVAFQLYEPLLCMPFGDYHAAVEQALGRPVWTHEFGLNTDGLRAELEGKRGPASVSEIFAQLENLGKPVVILETNP